MITITIIIIITIIMIIMIMIITMTIRENKFGATPLLPFGSLAFPGFGFVLCQ